MKTVTVSIPGRKYSIFIERGLLSSVGDIIKETLPLCNQVAVVTDSVVLPLYAQKVVSALVNSGIKTNVYSFQSGERFKTIDTINSIYSFFAQMNLSRNDAVIALGGGVVGDTAGFAAATYCRGISLIQMPTTLLAQVDSSVGGKTGVNLPQGKNLVGAFHQPKAVIVDPSVLETNDDRNFYNGMAEVIKYGCIADRALFESVLSCYGRDGILPNIDNVIYDCLNIKANIVALDETDEGLRRILNFGHTLGHAYERISGYGTFTHGEAVAAGMCAAVKIGIKLGVTDNDVLSLLCSALNNFSLPTNIAVSKKDVLKAIWFDKKSEGESINFVLLNHIGSTEIRKIDMEEFVAVL